MRLCAIVVLVLAVGAAACEQRPQPASNESSLNASPETQAASASSERGTTHQTVERSADPSPVPEAPAITEVIVPAGTTLSLVLDTPVGSDTSKVEDAVRAHLASPVVVNGIAALPAGSTVNGIVSAAERSGKVKGRARLAVQFTSVTREGETGRYDIDTSDVARSAASTKKKDAAKIAVPAVGGALVGGIIGGGKGAAVGTAVGGGAGTAVVLSTRGEEVRLGKGAAMKVQLTEALTVRVPRG